MKSEFGTTRLVLILLAVIAFSGCAGESSEVGDPSVAGDMYINDTGSTSGMAFDV